MRCPNCGGSLNISVDIVCTQSKKILRNGNLNKTKKMSMSETATDSPYLQCENPECGFTYDVEHASRDEPVEELDNWIHEHLEEIYNF